MANELRSKHITVGPAITQAEFEQANGHTTYVDSGAVGDILVGTSTVVETGVSLNRLAIGANKKILQSNGTTLSYVYNDTLEDSSGNQIVTVSGSDVGINQSSPDTMLHLTSTDGSSVIRLERNDVSIATDEVYGSIEFEGQDASASASGVRAKLSVLGNDVSGGADMVFYTAANSVAVAEAMRISKDKKVTFQGDCGDIQAAGSSGGTLTAKSEDVSLLINEKLGTLDFYSSDASANATGVGGRIFTAAEVEPTGAGLATYMSFATNTGAAGTLSEAMRINSDGEVGIGVTPTARLHIKEDSNALVKTLIDNPNDNTGAAATIDIFQGTTTQHNVFLGAFDGSYTTTAYRQRGVIGTDTTSDGITLAARGTSSDIRFFVDDSTPALNADEAMTIDTDGVTIANDLDVSGDTAITGDCDVTGYVSSPSIHEVSDERLILSLNFNTDTVISTTVLDGSPSALHGTNSSATHDPDGGFNGGGCFNMASTGYIEVLDNAILKPTDELSVSCWFYLNAAGPPPAGFSWLVTKGDSSPGTNGYMLQIDSGNDLSFTVNAINAEIDATTAGVVGQTWYHVVGTAVASGNTKIYLNGELQATSVGTLPASILHSTENLQVGAADYFASTPSNTRIDDVRVYNRTLTAPEIRAMYEQRSEIPSPRLHPGTTVLAVQTQPAAPKEGQLIYNSATNKLNFWTGAAWEVVTSS